MTERRIVYLDNSATTKICDEALKKYIEVSESVYGNPSSLHGFGMAAEKELKSARTTVLSSLGESERDSSVVFTASGSEANNLAIIGRAYAKERYARGGKIITTLGEHASVSSPIAKLQSLGFKVAEIPTKDGIVDLDALRREMTPDVILVSVMMVNNETGALYDIKKIAEIMRSGSPDAVLHVDATQSYMKIKFTRRSIGADMITLSSHKIEGPKGVGALVIDNRILKTKGLSPIILGGGQEGGLRSGTENVPAVSAFAEAVRIGAQHLEENTGRLEALRGYLINKIEGDSNLSEIIITNPTSHAPHILNITLPHIKSETVLHYLSSLGIYVSSGSACSSNDRSHSSPALTAYGRTSEEADSSIRISLSPKNCEEDIDCLCDALKSALARLVRTRK
jgi:cysteine desulfurase